MIRLFGHPSNCRRHFVKLARLYSDKYRSIEEFNKQKKEFKFGRGIDDLEEKPDESRDRKQRVEDKARGFQQFDIENYPQLQGLRQNSAEWKEQMALIQQQIQKDAEDQQKKYERNERLKGLGVGAFALFSIISAYTLVMNYKYIRGWVNNKWTFDIDESKIQDMNNPKNNRKSTDKILERLVLELAKDKSFKQNLADSTMTTGIYHYGTFSKTALPARIPFFNNKFVLEVAVLNDYIVSIDEKGQVYHYGKDFSEPIKIQLPLKIKHASYSGNNIYYLSQNEKDIFYGPKLNKNTINKTGGWFRSSSSKYEAKTVNLKALGGEKINSLQTGNNHLLILTDKGRLFEAVTNPDSLINKGQFGLPKYSPYNGRISFMENEAYELTNLNYQIVSENSTKVANPRPFSSIASGQFFNLAVEKNGNVWAWGDNAYGQCGKEVVSPDDIQPVPRLAYSLSELVSFLKSSLPNRGKEFVFSVKDTKASNKTSFILLQCKNQFNSSKDQDVLLTFGNGLAGQLGTSRYLHLSSTPMVVKSLVGLQEYDEKTNTTRNVGIKNVSTGNDHVLVSLDNCGETDDLVAFGDNTWGQFGNGKHVKSSKPIPLPKLLEPADFDKNTPESLKKTALKLDDVTRSRLLLLKNKKISGKTVEQVAVAGEDGSAIYYRTK